MKPKFSDENTSDFLKDLIDEVCEPLLNQSPVKTLKDMTPKERKKIEKEYKCKIKKEEKI